MAETPDGQEKTEPATGKRLSEARDRGQVSKSMDITTAAVLLFGGLAIYLIGKPLVENLQDFMKYNFIHSSDLAVNFENTQKLYLELVMFFVKSLFPLLLVILAIAFISEISQVGLKIATKKFTEGLMFRQILNPFSGLKRIFMSGRSVFELLKSVLKISLLGIIVYWVLDSRTDETVTLIEKPFGEIAAFIVSVSFELFYKVAGTFIIIALADYFYQKYRFKEDMKMTKQEVKEENKQAEGDPKIKARLRQIMRQRIRRLMLKNVKQADVVITNPTHFAVALEYKQGTMGAPKVTAKGLDYLALQIREIAEKSGVPVVEEPPLARTLYFNVQIDQEIPENMFRAVAQVLAYVYQLKRKKVA